MILGFEVIRFVLTFCFYILLGKPLTLRVYFAQTLALICEHLGGAFPKIGQILATRADLLPLEICEALSCLQDQVKALSPNITKQILDKYTLSHKIKNVDFTPIASGTIAQVHRGIRCDDNCEVALKVLRPTVREALKSDCLIIQFFGQFIAKLPAMQSIPVKEALKEASDILIGQTDFMREASNLKRLHALFANNHNVIVPVLHENLCTPEILVMEFIPGLQKLSDPALPEHFARKALTVGVQSLYNMIFKEGFIHCDMHPGNVLMAPDNRLVILDAGFMTQLDNSTRRNFARFFLSIAFCEGNTAAQIVRETATNLPSNLNIKAFDLEITCLIKRVGGLRARDFQVAGFVGELFAIQRKHGIYGTNQFTLTILSLLVFEGVAKQRFPDLNFQQEAVPFVMAALNKIN
ncbi:ABC1 kinase family protein [Dulcicalothrix desertica]|uniref:ABC1 kinase family protein n=1 Tax=Dulcicalothrix desertica TaxID=32056 RepID=UPI0013152032|nr:AarF/UbiB family protein [Dulcicalothrix desertica]